MNRWRAPPQPQNHGLGRRRIDQHQRRIRRRNRLRDPHWRKQSREVGHADRATDCLQPILKRAEVIPSSQHRLRLGRELKPQRVSDELGDNHRVLFGHERGFAGKPRRICAHSCSAVARQICDMFCPDCTPASHWRVSGHAIDSTQRTTDTDSGTDE